MHDIAPDMEELFRRASEDYPLKQGEDKWNEIASKINGNLTTQLAKRPHSSYRKYYATLLFLMMFLILDIFFSRPFPNQKTNKQNLSNIGIKQLNYYPKTNNSIAYKISEKTNNVNLSILSKNNFKTLQHDPINKKIDPQFSITKADIMGENIKTLLSINQPKNFTNDSEIKVLDKSIPSFMNINDIDPINANIHSLSNITLSDTGNKAKQVNPSQSNLAEKNTKNKTSMHGFYYGLLLGSELNTVKNQDMKKVGFNIGLIGGYRFNRHLSVETGVVFSQKYYTTTGKYFSLKEIGSMMPAATKVMDVTGSSKLIKIPVHVRYDIFNKKDHRFFSSAGFSSYMLTKESNQYHTSLNGIEGMMYGTYKNNRGYIAASLDFAIGYEKNIGKKSNISIQPYVQVPIKGIGVGNLKVMSTGVHLAFTRSTHKLN